MENNTLKDNFRFIGALDSARTAHVFEGNKIKESWWFPSDEQTWIEHNASAEAMTIKQVIWGDIIALSRNQFFDSPPWFNLAEYLMRIKEPTFSITIYPKELELKPDSFIAEISNSFIASESSFALSAWPSLDITERQTIGNNIKMNHGFIKMFDQIQIDSEFLDTFNYQRDVLQKVYKYLCDNYQKEGFSYLISRASGGKTSLWDKLWGDLQNDQFINWLINSHNPEFAESYKEVFLTLRDKALGHFNNESQENKNNRALNWLNKRTNLYHEIFQYNDDLRNILRHQIDARYNETLSESCTGIGRHVLIDRSDTSLYHEVRDDILDSLDSSNDPEGLLEDTDIIFAESSQTRHFFGSVVEILNDDEICMQIKNIRRIRREKYISQTFRRETEFEHLEFMANRIPELVIDDSAGVKIVLFTYNNLSLVTIAFGLLFFPDLPLGLGIGATIVKLLNEVLKEKIEGVIDTTIKKRGEKFLLDKLFRGRKRVLTGKVRDWLGEKRDSGG